jgi:hypothetical protein
LRGRACTRLKKPLPFTERVRDYWQAIRERLEAECDGQGPVQPPNKTLPLSFRLKQELVAIILLEKRAAFLVLDLVVGVLFIGIGFAARL